MPFKTTGTAQNPTDPVYTELVDTEKLLTREQVGPSDDIQSRINSYQKRAATLVFERAPDNNYQFSSPIETGQLTVLKGENANKRNWDGETFRTPHVLDFSASDVHGIISPTDLTYHPQAGRIERLTLFGSGRANGKAGIGLFDNANGNHTDLWDIDGVLVGYFGTGIDASTADSTKINRCEIHHCGQAVTLGFECQLEDSVVWNMDTSPAVKLNKPRASVIGNEIQPDAQIVCVDASAHGGKVNDNYFTFDFDIGLDINADNITAQGNSFDSAYNTAIRGTYGTLTAVGNTFNPNGTLAYLGNGASAVFMGNTIRSQQVADIQSGKYNNISRNFVKGAHTESMVNITTNNNLVAGNIASGADVSNCPRFADVQGTNNVIIWNQLPTGFTSESVRVQAFNDDNILIGHFPDGVADNAGRTIINGRSKNDGNPASSGAWNGNAERAALLDVAVVDTSASSPLPQYKAQRNGSGGYEWVSIGVTAA